MTLRTVYDGDGVSTTDTIIHSELMRNSDFEIDALSVEVYKEFTVNHGDELEYIDEDSNTVFKGIIKNILPADSTKTLVVYSYEQELQETIVEDTFTSVTPEGLIETLVTTYSSLTFSTSISTGITIDEYTSKNKTAWEIISDIMERMPGVTYYVNPSKVFTLFSKGSVTAPISLINFDNCIIENEWQQDTSNQTTFLKLVGNKQVRKDEIDQFNGTGAQADFVLTELPTTLKVFVGGVEQTLQRENTAAGDYTYSKETKTVSFVAGSIPPVGVNNVVCTYDFELNLKVEMEADPAIITRYGEIENKVTKKFLNSYDELNEYATEYLDIYGRPLFSNEAFLTETFDMQDLIPGYQINVFDDLNLIEDETVDRFFLINSITRIMPEGGITINVGDRKIGVIDFLKEVKTNLDQVKEEDDNATVSMRSQNITNEINIVATTEVDLELERTLPSDKLYLMNEISGLVGWWKANGTSADGSGNGNTATWTGTEQYAAGKPFTQAFDFDGSSEADSNLSTNPGSTSFSLNLWFKTAGSASNEDLLQKSGGTDFVIIRKDALDRIVFQIFDGTTSKAITTIGTYGDSTYHNVIGVVDRTNDVMQLFIDGSQISTDLDISAVGALAPSNNWKFGANDLSAVFTTGQIGDIRIYNKVLSSAERSDMYNSGLGLTSNALISEVGSGEDRVIGCEIGGANSLQGWWKFDGSSIDSSVNTNTATWTGTEQYDVGKQFDLVADFDGSSEADSNYGTSPGSNDFSISCWFKTAGSGSNEDLIQKSGGSDFIIIRKDAIDRLLFQIFDGTTSKSVVTVGTVSDSAYHLAIGVVDKTANLMYLYLDNSLIGSLDITAVGALNPSNNWKFGANDLSGVFTTGQIGDIRIYNTTLSANERSAIYNSGNGKVDNSYNELSDGTLGTSYSLSLQETFSRNPDLELSQLQVYYKFDDDVTDSSGNGNDGTAVGSPTFATGKIGNAIELNGSSQYVSNTEVPTAYPFTYMAWINTDTTTGDGTIISLADSSATNVYYRLIRSTNTILASVRNTTDETISSTTTISTSTWYHVAVVFTSSRIKLYINGVLESTRTITQTFNASTDELLVGVLRTNTPTDYFDGKIDDGIIVYRECTTEEIEARYNSSSGRANEYASWDQIQ